MADFPAELSTGMVHGRFIVAVIDGEDEGQEPDVIPAQGKVAFKASVGYIPVPVATGGPVTVMKGPIMGVLDSEGYLCTPNPATDEPMYRGVRLVSTDDPDMAVTGWTWSADYRLEAVNGNSMQIPAHSFALPSGSELDLTTLVKVPSSPGYGLPQAEAAVLRAEAAAQVALDVKAMADAGEFDGAQGLPGNATMRVDTSAGEAIYVTNGTTEKLVKYDSGLRDITAELKNGWTVGTSGYVRVRRQGNAVTYYIKNLSPAGATSAHFWTGIPDGFLPSTSGTYRQILATSATAFAVCSTRRFERDINIPTSAGTIGDQYSECAVTFQITAPLPTTLPGIPA